MHRRPVPARVLTGRLALCHFEIAGGKRISQHLSKLHIRQSVLEFLANFSLEGCLLAQGNIFAMQSKYVHAIRFSTSIQTKPFRPFAKASLRYWRFADRSLHSSRAAPDDSVNTRNSARLSRNGLFLCDRWKVLQELLYGLGDVLLLLLRLGFGVQCLRGGSTPHQFFLGSVVHTQVELANVNRRR